MLLRHETWADLFNTANYLWSLSYRAIDLANQVINSVPDLPAPNQQIENDKKRLWGEALFLRGLNYFVLNRFWAQPQNGLSVPLQITPFKPSDQPVRATIEEVKGQIIADLKEAETLMAGVTSNGGRATVYAVKALLARAYFEFKDYQNAEIYAEDVIRNGIVDGKRLVLLQEDLTPPFSSTITSENIFTLLGNPRDRANVRLFEMFSLQSSAVELSISDPFWDVISEESNDLRLKQLHEDFIVAHACYKYEDREMNIPFIRLPEMYLIRAEARANTGQLDLALADLNILRKRVNLPVLELVDQNDLLHKIFLNRSVELSMEGDNLHNLKRLEQSVGGYPFEEAAFKLVFFIPEREIQLNPNLVQNDIW